MTGIKEDTKKNRSFGLITGLLCLCLSGYYYLQVHTLSPWFTGAGLLFLVAGLLIPKILNPIRIAMEFAGHWLGIANTYILLTLLYFILFIPLHLIFKLTGKDDLHLKWSKKANSYWMETPKQNESSMKNQY
jgi:hypothetical protein